MLEWARKKVYIWLLKLYGYDKVLAQYGITDLDAYYNSLVKLLKNVRKVNKEQIFNLIEEKRNGIRDSDYQC